MTPAELKKFLPTAIKAKAPLLICGPPGSAKSALVEQAAAEIGADLIVDHPAVSDPTDFKGMPWITEGKANFVPFGQLKKACQAEKTTIYFLDDLGQASPAVQAACMQLLLARSCGENRLSDHTAIMAATNRREAGMGVTGMLDPVLTRFRAIVNLEVSLDDWCSWALKANMPTELIAAVRFLPKFLQEKPAKSGEFANRACPRTLASVGAWMNSGLAPDLEYEIFSGAAGASFAAEFCGFLKLYRSLAIGKYNPDAILLDPQNAPVPTDKEPDLTYALVTALSERMTEQTRDRLWGYFQRLSSEFSVLAGKAAVRKFPEAVSCRGYIEWCEKNKDVVL